MRQACTPSWRFAHDIDHSLHFALYLRESLSLEIKHDEAVPSRLAGEIPDHSEFFDPVATDQWLTWWRAVMALQSSAQLLPPSNETDQRTRRGQHAAQRPLVFDLPEWASLADSPALQSAARDLWVESYEWFGPARENYLPPASRDVFPWELVRDGAERAATDHDVKPGAINGCAQVLIVEGCWWRLVSPGAALCSIAAARDPDTIPIILTEVFDSYLATS